MKTTVNEDSLVRERAFHPRTTGRVSGSCLVGLQPRMKTRLPSLCTSYFFNQLKMAAHLFLAVTCGMRSNICVPTHPGHIVKAKMCLT